jgi:hypothetical protein
LGKRLKNTSAAYFAISHASGFNVTKSGRFAIPRARMFQWISAGSLTAETLGRGPLCVLRRMIGGRDAVAAYVFMHDLAGRLKNRIQLTKDGHIYLEAVESAFGNQNESLPA